MPRKKRTAVAGKKGLYPPRSAGYLQNERRTENRRLAGCLRKRASSRKPPHRPETHAHGYPGPLMWSGNLAMVGCRSAQPLSLVHAPKPRKEGGLLVRARHPSLVAAPSPVPQCCATPTCQSLCYVVSKGLQYIRVAQDRFQHRGDQCPIPVALPSDM
jgi:hypothetical protein